MATSDPGSTADPPPRPGLSLLLALVPYGAVVALIRLPDPLHGSPVGIGAVAVGAVALGLDLLRPSPVRWRGLGLAHLRPAAIRALDLLAIGIVVLLGLDLAGVFPVVGDAPPLELPVIGFGDTVTVGGGRTVDVGATFAVALGQGLLQQAFFQGHVHLRLREPLGERGAVLATGVLFGAIHLPDVPLVLVTLPMGVAFAGAFRRHPNVWPLGLAHGILAGLALAVLGWDLGIR